MVPKQSLTGDSPDRVDPRVLRGPKRAASDFFTSGRRFFALGPAIHWPIVNAARIHDNIDVQDLRQEQALLAYRQTCRSGSKRSKRARHAS